MRSKRTMTTVSTSSLAIVSFGQELRFEVYDFAIEFSSKLYLIGVFRYAYFCSKEKIIVKIHSRNKNIFVIFHIPKMKPS